MTTTYNKICELFEQRIGSCTRKTTRTLLAPILMSINLYEKERATSIRQKLFAEICTEFQVLLIISIEIILILTKNFSGIIGWPKTIMEALGNGENSRLCAHRNSTKRSKKTKHQFRFAYEISL
jgi:hypothetical protein